MLLSFLFCPVTQLPVFFSELVVFVERWKSIQSKYMHIDYFTLWSALWKKKEITVPNAVTTHRCTADPVNVHCRPCQCLLQALAMFSCCWVNIHSLCIQYMCCSVLLLAWSLFLGVFERQKTEWYCCHSFNVV